MKSHIESDEPLVSVRDLSFALHQKKMLANLSWSLNSGESISVVGPNGAGKTSLLRVLVGLYRGYQGSVKVAGSEIKHEPVESLAKLVSLVPQRMEFLPGFTVAEFIELSGPKNAPHVGSLIGDLEQRLLPELSAGELQRVVIAGAVAQGVRVLLLDEPTSNLDPNGRANVEQILTACRKDLGISFVLVTHDISLALRCCSRMLIMVDGQCYWQGAASHEAVVDHLEAAYRCGFVRYRSSSTGDSVVVPA
jgi:ABC-type cobalamin/Fe3+-siderophores transport system ATPase subunit